MQHKLKEDSKFAQKQQTLRNFGRIAICVYNSYDW